MKTLAEIEDELRALYRALEAGEIGWQRADAQRKILVELRSTVGQREEAASLERMKDELKELKQQLGAKRGGVSRASDVSIKMVNEN